MRHTAVKIFAAGVFAFSFSACSKAAPGDVQAASTSRASDAGIPDVLATIGNDKITLNDVRDRVGEQLDQLEANYKKSRSQAVETALNQLIRERVIDDE